jgi:hypothetical protein
MTPHNASLKRIEPLSLEVLLFSASTIKSGEQSSAAAAAPRTDLQVSID